MLFDVWLVSFVLLPFRHSFLTFSPTTCVPESRRLQIQPMSLLQLTVTVGQPDEQAVWQPL
jgi:hypothetical protein